ncbi:MAG TPA: class I SAM-dependent methyltransferase [Reyranella sp.]|nr:class I SAM-dependent methyltransferase [Reyranella sp.]
MSLSSLAKRLLPRPIKRFLILRLTRPDEHYARLMRMPSRLYLQNEIMPWLGRNCRSVLFVGAGVYVRHFEKLFRRGEYMTIDREPAVAVWGARRHIVGSILDINRHMPKGSFDCVVLNGIFGFGVNEPADMRAVVRELHDALQPGGLLIVGWNTNLMDDPDALDIYAPYFVPNDRPPLNARRRFDLPETHVYDFYKRAD